MGNMPGDGQVCPCVHCAMCAGMCGQSRMVVDGNQRVSAALTATEGNLERERTRLAASQAVRVCRGVYLCACICACGVTFSACVWCFLRCVCVGVCVYARVFMCVVLLATVSMCVVLCTVCVCVCVRVFLCVVLRRCLCVVCVYVCSAAAVCAYGVTYGDVNVWYKWCGRVHWGYVRACGAPAVRATAVAFRVQIDSRLFVHLIYTVLLGV